MESDLMLEQRDWDTGETCLSRELFGLCSLLSFTQMLWWSPRELFVWKFLLCMCMCLYNIVINDLNNKNKHTTTGHDLFNKHSKYKADNCCICWSEVNKIWFRLNGWFRLATVADLLAAISGLILREQIMNNEHCHERLALKISAFNVFLVGQIFIIDSVDDSNFIYSKNSLLCKDAWKWEVYTI